MKSAAAIQAVARILRVRETLLDHGKSKLNQPEPLTREQLEYLKTAVQAIEDMGFPEQVVRDFILRNEPTLRIIAPPTFRQTIDRLVEAAVRPRTGGLGPGIHADSKAA